MDKEWRESESLKNVQVEQPALFIGGERDPATMFGSLEAMREGVPNLRKTIPLPEAGHLPQLQHPEIINAEIVDFLGRGIKHQKLRIVTC
jgi:pimeloyl-ACP methyl ester carboxylesterase